jgi:Uncharacterized conserved protein
MAGYAITQIEVTNPEDYKQYFSKSYRYCYKIWRRKLGRGGEFHVLKENGNILKL